MAKNIYVGKPDVGRHGRRPAFGPVPGHARGQVARAQVVTDRETGRSRGFGFVEMDDDAEAQKSIDALNGQPFLRGRPLTIKRGPSA